MLELKNIVKIYGEGENSVTALKGVSVNFRKNEFVSILGQSGCGKTTLLNIIGGLDRYTEGDLVINGVSTKDYADSDWDTYRNHSVGFVFQSYNLIPHQTVLKNVELALTLSGVNKEDRKRRAFDALKLVGLEDQINKRPNQLSGGQMQRVAIARAIVNDPEIILADEPTGALDSQTSVQVMDILKLLSKDRLVIMVTHNGELAEEYSTRIINLKDGLVAGDTNPASDGEIAPKAKVEKTKEKAKKPSMSFLTALSLSLNNLFTKKGRTILTAFAGSIGIIGIALILSLSTGFNAYVNNVQRDTLSSSPITITSTNIDATKLLTEFLGNAEKDLPDYPKTDKVTSNNMISDMLGGLVGTVNSNDLASFKTYLDANLDKNLISAIEYSYSFGFNIFPQAADVKNADNSLSYRRVYPLDLPNLNSVLPSGVSTSETQVINSYYNTFKNFTGSMPTFSSMLDNMELITAQYDLLGGAWPKEATDVIVVLDTYNQISDINLYGMGLMNDNDIKWALYRMVQNSLHQAAGKFLTSEELDNICDDAGYTRSQIYKEGCTVNDLLKLKFKAITYPEAYVKNGTADDVYEPEIENPSLKNMSLWRQCSTEELTSYLDGQNNATVLNVVGVVRKKQGVTAGCLSSAVCYMPSLRELLMDKTSEMEIVKQQTKLADVEYRKSLVENLGFDYAQDYLNVFAKTATELRISKASYENISTRLGIVDRNVPNTISLYPADFEAKEEILAFIDDYNSKVDKQQQIKYTDYMGLIMNSVTKIINAVTYVLIAFVSISLIVSSIMISIITYISVIERTKEIGVLRSVGASKHDITRVFNAETTIVGFVAGLLGILVTLLINIPINAIIESLAGLAGVAVLPALGAVILVVISVVLTMLAGLIPAFMASKKDPVVALRTE